MIIVEARQGDQRWSLHQHDDGALEWRFNGQRFGLGLPAELLEQARAAAGGLPDDAIGFMVWRLGTSVAGAFEVINTSGGDLRMTVRDAPPSRLDS
jgi:hypothetical protein